MATAERILQIAAGELGYSRWDDPLEGTKFGRWYAEHVKDPYFGTNGVPYCDMFVSWVFFVAGTSIFGDGRVYAYCPYTVRDARAAGRLRSFDDIQPGDVVLFDWDSDGVADHVGFAVRRDGNYVLTIEGNTSPNAYGSQSHGGGVYRRARSRDHVCAVVRPVYDRESSPATGDLYADIRGVQRALNTAADSVSGPETRQHLHALKAASVYGGESFPYGVMYAQKVVGTYQDGVWGDDSRECHDRAVWRLQEALRAMGYPLAVDGVFGPDTDRCSADALKRAEQA